MITKSIVLRDLKVLVLDNKRLIATSIIPFLNTEFLGFFGYSLHRFDDKGKIIKFALLYPWLLSSWSTWIQEHHQLCFYIWASIFSRASKLLQTLLADICHLCFPTTGNLFASRHPTNQPVQKIMLYSNCVATNYPSLVFTEKLHLQFLFLVLYLDHINTIFVLTLSIPVCV
jgi:hypothetical protein